MTKKEVLDKVMECYRKIDETEEILESVFSDLRNEIRAAKSILEEIPEEENEIENSPVETVGNENV